MSDGIWTEVPHEDVGAVHVGDVTVIVPLADGVDPLTARSVKRQLQWERGFEMQLEQHKELRRDLKQKQRARERFREAGYDDDEIPL